MLKNLAKKFFVCSMWTLSLAAAEPAFADYSANWTGCQTQSQGRQFRDADYGIDGARARTVQGCTQDPNTNNGECRYNVNCEGEIPGAYARCMTSSKGRTFRDGSADINQARNSVIQGCERDANTNNGECRYNISCQGGAYYPQPTPPVYEPTPPPYNPPYTPAPPIGEDPNNQQTVCSTQSNGRSFSVPGRGIAQTRFKVITVCQQSPYTDKYACEQNAYCQ